MGKFERKTPLRCHRRKCENDLIIQESSTSVRLQALQFCCCLLLNDTVSVTEESVKGMFHIKDNCSLAYACIDAVAKLRPTNDRQQAVCSCAAAQTIPPISCAMCCNRQATDHILRNCVTLYNLLIISSVNPAHTSYILCYSAIVHSILIISCTLLHQLTLRKRIIYYCPLFYCRTFPPYLLQACDVSSFFSSYIKMFSSTLLHSRTCLLYLILHEVIIPKILSDEQDYKL